MRTVQWLIIFSSLVIPLGRALAACPAPLSTLPPGQVDVSQARAVGIPLPDAPSGVQRVSGVRVGGESFVVDVQWGGLLIRPLRNSVTPSMVPTISNLRAEVFPDDLTICWAEYPDRVQLSFDYEDCNGDVLGGRVGVNWAATGVGGAGPTTGFIVADFFRSASSMLTSPTATIGTASLVSCWSNAEHIDFSLRLRDADENLSPETLSISVDIP